MASNVKTMSRYKFFSTGQNVWLALDKMHFDCFHIRVFSQGGLLAGMTETVFAIGIPYSPE